MTIGLYIPYFNAVKSLSVVLNAVFQQTIIPEEVVIIDDACEDNIVGIAAKYPARIIRHKTNKGLAASRNTAIRNMKTGYIAALDVDCVPEPDWLEILLKRLNSSKVAGAGGRLVEKNTTSIYDRWRSIHMRQHWDDRKDAPDFLFGSNTVFLRQALLDSGLYDETLKNNYEDVKICERLKEKGYTFAYEPRAVVYHLKQDTIYSVLNNYWRWYFAYYREQKFYESEQKFIYKIKDNIGLANRYIEEDLAGKRTELIYIDFLLALHHSVKDFECYMLKKNTGFLPYSKTALWFSLLDLNFFHHFDVNKKCLSTLLPESNAVLHNFFACILLMAETVKLRFKNKNFQLKFCKHLIQSIYSIDDDILIKITGGLMQRRNDWGTLLDKDHRYLKGWFLKHVSSCFDEWLKSLVANKPETIKIIENAVEKIG